jgi:hypothetical protein
MAPADIDHKDDAAVVDELLQGERQADLGEPLAVSGDDADLEDFGG